MNCPKDRSPMIVVEHDQVALDYCPTCRGVWFDRGELELVMEQACGRDADLCLTDIMTRAEVATSEQKRRCPICNQQMRKEHAGKDPAVLIDACVRGDGLWFDGGEIHQVLSQLGEPEANADAGMLAFIKETLKADIVE